MRINQYIATKKNVSRRQADKLIAEKRVKINGRIAILGDRVNQDDDVEIDETSLKKTNKKLVYLIFNKPVGIVSNVARKGQTSIQDVLRHPTQVFPVGRLDKNSRGLIILSNDGRVTERLLHPKHIHEKEYIVIVDKIINNNFVQKMQQGIKIDGYKTKKCKIQKLTSKKFKIILTEGKKRQIRMMCSTLNYNVVDLERVRIMDIKLGGLQIGKYRELEGAELKKFLSGLGIKS